MTVTNLVGNEPCLCCSRTPVSPPESLTSAQHEAVDQIHAQLAGLIPADVDQEDAKRFADQGCLKRYLRARKWKVDEAAKLLQGTLRWRHVYQPHNITADDVKAEAVGGNNFVCGFDKAGHPIVWLKKREKPKDFEKNVRCLVYSFETAIRALPEGVEQVCLVMDFQHYTFANAPPFSVSKQSLDIFSNHYPERLAHCILLNAPSIFFIAFNVLKPFIHPATAAKLHFVYIPQPRATTETGPSKGKKDNALLKFIDEDQLLAEYGGSYKFQYNHDAYTRAVGALVTGK